MHNQCMRCGNPFDRDLTRCPHCSYDVRESRATAITIRNCNVKINMPDAESAREHLRVELDRAARDGVRVVKLVHGYGSSGKGGKLRHVIRRVLNAMCRSGALSAFIIGEEWSPGNTAAKSLIRKFPKLRTDSDYNRRNPGITLAILS